MINLVYLHGFQSNPRSLKAQQLQAYLQAQLEQNEQAEFNLHLPDLNFPPQQVMQKLQHMVQTLPNMVFVGSSFGAFYATQMVARYGCPAVLINPAMRPWQLFRSLFGEAQLPYKVSETWTLTAEHLSEMQQIHFEQFPHADKILVLLQQGDEVLDYLEAQRYYKQQHPMAMIMTEYGGNHTMDNFNEKIPMLLTFLKHSLLVKGS